MKPYVCVVSMALCGLVLTSCATSGPGDTAEADSSVTVMTNNVAKASDRYSFPLEKLPLGLAVREVSAATQQGLALMNGLENYPLPALEFSELTLSQIVNEIAKETGCGVQNTDNYFFLYAPNYTMLTQVNLDGRINPSVYSENITMSFGADTPLFNVLALMSRSLGLTLVADNAIAEARTGELHLVDAPLDVALEMILKSARVRDVTFKIESNPEFVFIYSSGIQPRSTLAQPAADAASPLLDPTCSISLLMKQTDENTLEGQMGASRLEEVLADFSVQLGISVSAEPALAKLPVNPMVLSNVTRRTALELLIRQWLLPQFGYEVVGNGVVLRYLGPER